jgi:hypothetical protein
MISIFVAITDGFKRKFTFSFSIKFFSYWYLKIFKRHHPEFKWMKMKDIPTHALTGWAILNGVKKIFESNDRQELKDYYPSKYEFTFIDGVNESLFWKNVKSSVGKPYAYLQIAWFLKTWVWGTFFPFLIPLWGETFHGSKNIFLWKNMFPNSRICTEQGAELMKMYSLEYDYPITKSQLSRANFNNIFPLLLLDMLLTIYKNKEMTLKEN